MTETDGSTTPTTSGDCEAVYPIEGPLALSVDSPSAEVIDVAEACGFILDLVGPSDDPEMDLKLIAGVDNYRVRIYRPALEGALDQWPEDRLPLVVFSPGACLSVVTPKGEELYRHLFEPLAEKGFVVLANEVPLSWNVSKRMRAMFCTMVWDRGEGSMAWTEADNDRLNCDMVAMGHSRGGEAAYNVVALYPDFASFAGGLDLKAAVGIAPRLRTVPSLLDPDITSGTIAASRGVPYLTLMGGNDGDVWGDALQAYDRMGPEEGNELPAADKVLMWAYDVSHGAWGG